MITGRPYAEVLWLAIERFDFTREGPHFTTVNELRCLLSLYDVQASRVRKFRDFDGIGELALLFTNARQNQPGHWVVWERTAAGPRILNPSRRVKRPIHRQLGRLRIANVVELQRPNSD